MSDSLELSTQYIISDITDEYFVNEDMVKKCTDKIPKTYFMYYPIDVSHDVVITSIIFCVGLVLNTLNLRLYWRVKTSTAVYIRGMAFIDVCVIIYVLLRTFLQYFPSEPVLYIISGALGNFAAVVNVLAPLFMALDRILIVAFPHSFKKHEKNMRIAKISWATFQCSFLAVIFIAKFLFGNQSGSKHHRKDYLVNFIRSSNAPLRGPVRFHSLQSSKCWTENTARHTNHAAKTVSAFICHAICSHVINCCNSLQVKL